MRKNLAVLAGLSAAISGLVGCERHGLITSDQSVKYPRNYRTPDNVKGHRLERVNNGDARYDLEGVVIHGDAYYVESNELPIPGESNIYLHKRNESTRRIAALSEGDVDRVVNTDANTVYIPTQVRRQDQLGLAHNVILATEGPSGIKAKVTKYDTSNVKLGRFRENQSNLNYNIPTISINTPNGKPIEWFVPAVESDKLGDGNAPFYMMPVNSTTLLIDQSTGQITLSNYEGVWRPMAMSAEALSFRNTERRKALIEAATEENRRQQEMIDMLKKREKETGQALDVR